MGSNMFLFLMVMMMGFLISLCSSNWLMCWCGMEISTLSLMPLLLMNKFSCLSSESSMKYFMIQAFSSVLLVISGFMFFELMIEINITNLMMLISISLKLGVFPGHFWVISVAKGLEPMMCFLIFGPFKIIPLLLISELFKEYKLLVAVSFTSMILGMILGNNQTKMMGVIGASSISHGGWMVMSSIFGGLWIYFSFYFLTMLMMFLFMIKQDMLNMSISVLSMSGLPPFAMFYGKIFVTQLTLSVMNFTFMMIPMISALISLFFYLKFFYSFLLYVHLMHSNYYLLMWIFNFFMLPFCFFIFYFKMTENKMGKSFLIFLG